MDPAGLRPPGDGLARDHEASTRACRSPGAQKYGTHDARDILERASARETAARTAAGAVAKALL